MISVVVPIYNMEKYLSRCIDSIRSQTYSDIEIILVDDGSVDTSLQICKAYEHIDKRIIVVEIENSGVSVARNVGIEHSSGNWIMFVDPDDVLCEDIIEKLMGINIDSDIMCCSCYVDTRGIDDIKHSHLDKNSFLQNENSFYPQSTIFTDVPIDETTDFEIQPKRELLIKLMYGPYKTTTKTWTAIGVPWAKLYKRDFLKTEGLKFDNRLVRMQDNIFNMHAFDKAERVVYIDYPAYIYTYNHVRNFQNEFDPYVVRYFDLVCQERYSYLKNKGLESDTDLMFYFHNEVLGLIWIMIKKFFANPDNKSTLLLRKKELTELCTTKPYTEVIKNASTKNMTLSKKAVTLCLRNHLLGFLLTIAKFYVYIKV